MAALCLKKMKNVPFLRCAAVSITFLTCWQKRVNPHFSETILHVFCLKAKNENCTHNYMQKSSKNAGVFYT